MTQHITSEIYDLDQTVRPQDDFFGYVNNTWLKEHPIPASEVRWGVFNVLRDNAWKHMRELYEELEDKDLQPGSVQQQARDFYYAGMHMDDFSDTHLQLVSSLFAEIDQLRTTHELARVMGRLQSMWLGGPWSTYVNADDTDSTVHTLYFSQSGLTLPNRDYYLEDSKKMKAIRAEYEKQVHRLYPYFPDLAETAESLWEAVYGFEYELAKHSRTSVELRDVKKNYNKMSFEGLKQTYGNIDWDSYATALGWRPNDQISINQPEFMAFVNQQVAKQPLEAWKTYLKWRVVIRCAAKVSSELSQLQFEFFGKVLSGTTKLMPLWKRVVLAADDAMGESVGRLYAKKHFPEASKQQVLGLVEEVRDVYRERIKRLDWMSDKTKAYALKKLSNIKVLIGYPDEWRDFSGLTITRDSYLGNYLAAARFQGQYWLDRLHTPTSREDWFMYPQTVNAYHDPNRLVICFPAAILQAPFFDPNAHAAANLGGIGTVIGHELTHGFDDQGRLYDADGNVRTWQTEKEQKAFKQKAEVIIKQADAFKVLPDLHLKGGLIVGESIADLGGLEIAYEALEKYLDKDDGRTTKEGLSARQLFFVNFARTECSRTREEKLREYALVDPHPPAEFRVNCMMMHVERFYDLFNVNPDDKLYLAPEKRAAIW